MLESGVRCRPIESVLLFFLNSLVNAPRFGNGIGKTRDLAAASLPGALSCIQTSLLFLFVSFEHPLEPVSWVERSLSTFHVARELVEILQPTADVGLGQ